MYEMYPPTWAAAEASASPLTAARPRRRVRAQHSVLPAVLVYLTRPVEIAPPVATEPAAG